jgi:hypothetical protein
MLKVPQTVLNHVEVFDWNIDSMIASDFLLEAYYRWASPPTIHSGEGVPLKCVLRYESQGDGIVLLQRSIDVTVTSSFP